MNIKINEIPINTMSLLLEYDIYQSFNKGKKYISHDHIMGRWVALDNKASGLLVERFKEKLDALEWLER